MLAEDPLNISLLSHICPFGSSDSNSSSSDGSHARSVQSSATHAPPSQPCSMVMEGDEPRRSFGIRVQNLPVRSTGEYH